MNGMGWREWDAPPHPPPLPCLAGMDPPRPCSPGGGNITRFFISSTRPTKCYLAPNQNRARFWLYAGNHVEPEEEIRNCAFFHARDSDLP